MTHLYGNQLTEKDNPVIVFRGKLDSLCAMILEAQVLGRDNSGFVNDLQDILEFVRSLFSVEYKRVPLGEFRILGYDSKEIRERSHNPEKYFGRKRLVMHHSMGPLPLRLNFLRTTAREAELAAVSVLREIARNPKASGIQDAEHCYKDIVEALNRLSSLFYMLMYKYLL